MRERTIPVSDAMQELSERKKYWRRRMRQIEERISANQAEFSEAKKALIEITEIIDEYRLANKRVLNAAGLGKVTARNANFYRAWAAIQRVYKDTYLYRNIARGVQQSVLYNEVRKAIPNLKAATFRSYLHRLKKAGHLEKRENLWYLKN